MMRARHRPSRGRDIAVAAIVTLIATGATTSMAQEVAPARPLDWFAYVLLLGGGAVLVVRRRVPAAVLVITGACALTLAVMGYVTGGPFAFPLMIALFTAVAQGQRVLGVTVATVFLVVFVINGVVAGGPAREALQFVPGWTVAAVVAGEFARSRGQYVAEARRRATESRRSREEQMRRRETEERLRIAREVHDVLSHSISMINVQAGVAVHLLDSQPEQARTALVAIKQASKDALRDLRATLGVLRDGDDDDRGPARGLGRTEQLVSGAAAAGVNLEVVTHGDLVPLPANVDLAAYRIVQQSVSNIVRHAGSTSGVVELRFGPDELTIVVDNAPGARDGDSAEPAPTGDRTPGARTGDGRPGAVPVDDHGEPGAGNGIRGMRERAEALGGALIAGARPGGGFRVEARLPVADRP